jgi:hypothetical protein
MGDCWKKILFPEQAYAYRIDVMKVIIISTIINIHGTETINTYRPVS